MTCASMTPAGAVVAASVGLQRLTDMAADGRVRARRRLCRGGRHDRDRHRSVGVPRHRRSADRRVMSARRYRAHSLYSRSPIGHTGCAPSWPAVDGSPHVPIRA